MGVADIAASIFLHIRLSRRPAYQFPTDTSKKTSTLHNGLKYFSRTC